MPIINSTSRPVCACCGRPYGRRATVSKDGYFAEGSPHPDPPPASGLRSLRPTTRPHGDMPDGSGRKRMMITWTFWDGVSWLVRYEPFCTLRCALDFARAAHRAGYRITQTEQPIEV